MRTPGMLKQTFSLSLHQNHTARASMDHQGTTEKAAISLPESRFSRALLQNVSQALLVESFTCSLKDLLSGVFTVCAISIRFPVAFHSI